MSKLALVALAALLTACGPLEDPSFRLHQNLSYGPDPKNGFDLYKPAGRTSPRPLVVAIHPGAWQGDDKSWVQHFAGQYAGAGFALASINYRLAPTDHWPAQIDDVRAAIRFFRAAHQELGIDPGRIAVLGDSAGGQLALLAGLQDDPLAAPDQRRPGACVSGDGETDLAWANGFPGEARTLELLFGHVPDRTDLVGASPISWVRPDASVLLVHGELDPFMDVAQADAFAARLRSVGADLLYLRRHSAEHIPFKDARVNRVAIDWLSHRI